MGIVSFESCQEELLTGTVNTNQQKLDGRWIYFDGDSKDLSDVDWSKWKNLEL